MKEIGKATIFDSFQQKDLEIVSVVQSTFKDNRLVTVAKLEDNSYCLSVENPQSSGRAMVSTMRLTEDSFIGLLATSFMYFEHNKEDLTEKVQTLINNDIVQYRFNDNNPELIE